jgi:hypothetical protein
MAVYMCHHCGNYKDNDWEPGEDDPSSEGFDLICPDCLGQLEEDEEEQLRIKRMEKSYEL